MNIIEPYARLIDIETPEDGVKLLRKIEWCGRISHRSEDAQTAGSTERFLRAVVLGHGDWSIVEHASVSVDFYVDRGVTHELVRHRLFAFTQESTRFVNYEKKMPPSFVVPVNMNRDSVNEWEKAISQCEDTYRTLLAAGQPPQIARSVFPNALASRIVVTGNLRNWRHFIRSGGLTAYEIKDWAAGNMNWDDVKHAAVQVPSEEKVDWQEGWTNGEKKIVGEI